MKDHNAHPLVDQVPTSVEAPAFDEMTELLGNLDAIQHTVPIVEHQRRVLALTEASEPGAAKGVIDALKAAKDRKSDKRPLRVRVAARNTGTEDIRVDEPDNSDKNGTFTDSGRDFVIPNVTLFDQDADYQLPGSAHRDEKDPRFVSSAVKKLTRKIPPLIPDYVGKPIPAPKQLTAEELAIIEYENRNVATTRQRVARLLGLAETPNPGIAASNVRLDTIDLKIRAVEQSKAKKPNTQSEGKK